MQTSELSLPKSWSIYRVLVLMRWLSGCHWSILIQTAKTYSTWKVKVLTHAKSFKKYPTPFVADTNHIMWPTSPKKHKTADECTEELVQQATFPLPSSPAIAVSTTQTPLLPYNSCGTRYLNDFIHHCATLALYSQLSCSRRNRNQSIEWFLHCSERPFVSELYESSHS